jgi:hypothetical protein
MMRRWSASAIALLWIAGCTLKAPGGSVVAPTSEGVITGPKVSAAPILKASAPAAPPLSDALPRARRDALVSALHNLVAANRAARVTTAVRETSGIISNNSGGIVSDNGLGLIGNNGGSYRVLAAETSVTETADLVYVVNVLDEKHGEFKTYDKAAYKAATTDADKEKALLDHFKWDDLTVVPTGAPPTLTVDVQYHLKKVSAKRLTFLDTILQHEIHEVTFTSPTDKPTDKIKRLELEFDTVVTLLDGQTDSAHFKCTAGEADIVFNHSSDGGDQYFPTRFDVTGSHPNGTFSGEMKGTDYPLTTVEHLEKGTNKKTRLTVEVKKGGALTRTIEIPDQQLRVALDSDATGQGAGKLYDTTTTTPREIGTITWDTDGLGVVDMEGARVGERESFQVRLF